VAVVASTNGADEGASYWDLAEVMQVRGVDVDASTIFRWVQSYVPELEKRVRWYRGYRSGSWRDGETYDQIGNQSKYKHGDLIDFMLLGSLG
jgi:IS6 family transposase